jgi:hypothetical protein
VQSQARLCLFGIAQLHSLTRDTIRRPGGEESFSGHAIFFTTFCIWLAEISAVLVLDDLLNMSFEHIRLDSVSACECEDSWRGTHILIVSAHVMDRLQGNLVTNGGLLVGKSNRFGLHGCRVIPTVLPSNSSGC